MLAEQAKLIEEVRKRALLRGKPYSECEACMNGRMHTKEEDKVHELYGFSREHGTPKPKTGDK